MPLTPASRIELLGRDELKRIAKHLGRTARHVASVARVGPIDPEVRAAIARAIRKKRPDLTFADIWPESKAMAVGSTVAA
jgi:hypothetical protein